MSKEIEYAYAAGLIDGEGTITLTRHNKTSQYRWPTVSIPSTTPELLAYMQQVYGGTVSKKRKSKEGHSSSGVWTLSSEVAIEFLNWVISYLREPEKIRRARMLIDKYKKVTMRNGRYNAEQRKAKLEFEREFFNSPIKASRNTDRIRW